MYPLRAGAVARFYPALPFKPFQLANNVIFKGKGN
ncbi:hypothetical protein X474_17955 [Dethiosulfatarculus sandiegensis]|uniref:Uncharacterized protein n=1 Tax=Dethiosulfatarculus sandiegensis TaxID=1429043 RepID=A0A0D2HQB2_9BACT|nr:hypothetical protein X474_17955 [Dethiosulfatarculus sandiegensis]